MGSVFLFNKLKNLVSKGEDLRTFDQLLNPLIFFLYNTIRKTMNKRNIFKIIIFPLMYIYAIFL
jgi:hypothetical protein